MTTQINIDSKSQLAKLIATENIQVQHNNVRTASFDTFNRVLTLPIFKVQSGDVYDMLIAHECAHALYTPSSGWKTIMEDDELRAYCNVLEDCRIDKKIQKKYPGVVKNYIRGFDNLLNQDFFGISNKDINTDLMLIDKINLYYKSSKTLPFKFTNMDKVWLALVDNLKTWNDVVSLAKKLLNWQKKQLEKLKKLPDFDTHPLVENYNLDDTQDSDNNVNTKSSDSNNNNSNNEDNTNQINESKEDDDNNKKNKIEGKISSGDGPVGGGQGKLSVITDNQFESNKQKLLDTSTSYNYMSIPDPKLSECVHTYKDFLKDFRKFFNAEITKSNSQKLYYQWLKDEFKKFKNDNKKTVMYLVKEFEMKKAATAYKRVTSDKTGVIDPLKLRNYKFSDDIFKRLTIVPNAKNHGMMMLLDWSGSMSDVIKNTVDQLINLVYFCQKIQIPYEVYLFTSEFMTEKDKNKWDEYESNKPFLSTNYNFKHGDMLIDSCKLINIASHKMKKTELDESLTYLYSMSLYYDNRYANRGFWTRDIYSAAHYNFGMPSNYQLGNTPLNEAIIICNKLISVFKNKYNIEKMTFITLTDGAANSIRGKLNMTPDGMKNDHNYSGRAVLKFGKKQYTTDKQSLYESQSITSLLLTIIKKEHAANTIGFFILKRMRGWDAEKYLGSNYTTDEKYLKRRAQLRKNKVAVVTDEYGYDEFYVLNKKHLNVENSSISDIPDTAQTKDIRKAFSNSMKGRITSRVLLNKFIEKVA